MPLLRSFSTPKCGALISFDEHVDFVAVTLEYMKSAAFTSRIAAGDADWHGSIGYGTEAIGYTPPPLPLQPFY